jgi:hypothetical protein
VSGGFDGDADARITALDGPSGVVSSEFDAAERLGSCSARKGRTKPPKKASRRAWAALAVWAFGVVVSLVVLLVWPFWMSTYDETHRKTIGFHAR